MGRGLTARFEMLLEFQACVWVFLNLEAKWNSHFTNDPATVAITVAVAHYHCHPWPHGLDSMQMSSSRLYYEKEHAKLQ